jgi:hypothetical protein
MPKKGLLHAVSFLKSKSIDVEPAPFIDDGVRK